MRTRTAAGARAKSSKKARAARASSNAAPVLASKLAKAFATLARELPNPATDFFRSFVAPMPPDSRLDAGTFQQALKIGGRYEVVLSSADALLSGAGDPDNSGEEIAQGFRLLEKVMRATLSELSVAFARAKGVVRVRMWLFGRSDDGTLVGLRSTSTET